MCETQNDIQNGESKRAGVKNGRREGCARALKSNGIRDLGYVLQIPDRQGNNHKQT